MEGQNNIKHDEVRLISDEIDDCVEFIEREELGRRIVEEANTLAEKPHHKTSVDAAVYNIKSFIRNILAF